MESATDSRMWLWRMVITKPSSTTAWSCATIIRKWVYGPGPIGIPVTDRNKVPTDLGRDFMRPRSDFVSQFIFERASMRYPFLKLALALALLPLLIGCGKKA